MQNKKGKDKVFQYITSPPWLPAFNSSWENLHSDQQTCLYSAAFHPSRLLPDWERATVLLGSLSWLLQSHLVWRVSATTFEIDPAKVELAIEDKRADYHTLFVQTPNLQQGVKLLDNVNWAVNNSRTLRSNFGGEYQKVPQLDQYVQYNLQRNMSSMPQRQSFMHGEGE